MSLHQICVGNLLSKMCIAQKPDSANTQETCTTYNMLKLARSLYRWTGDSKYADWYERGLLNGILGTQRVPQDRAQLPQHRPRPLASLPLVKHVVPAHTRPQLGNSTGKPRNRNVTTGGYLCHIWIT